MLHQTIRVPRDVTMNILLAMRNQEENAYHLPVQHLKELAHQGVDDTNTPDDVESSSNSGVSSLRSYLRWRGQMAQWCYSIADTCDFENETVEIAMSMLDRYVAAESATICDSSRTFQLAAMTCLYTASKIHQPQCLALDQMESLSDGKYVAEELEQSEQQVLTAIQWHVNPPTAMAFARHLLELIPLKRITDKDIVLSFCQDQIKLATIDPELFPVKASLIGFGALMNAIQWVSNMTEPGKSLAYFGKLFRKSLVKDDNNATSYEKRIIDKIRSKLSNLVTLCSSLQDDDSDDSDETTAFDVVDQVPEYVLCKSPSRPVSPVSVATRKLSIQ